MQFSGRFLRLSVLSGSFRLQFDLNEVAEVVLIDRANFADAVHAFHMHGYSFRVVGMERVRLSVSLSVDE